MDINSFLTILYQSIVNPIIRLAFAVSLIVFFWGVYEYIKSAESTDGRKKGGQHILYGLIGMAMMMSVFGIINFLEGTIDMFR